jgi:excinuclease UvrABC ATPase subunit
VSLSPNENIVVRGARVHNLKNIDFQVPHKGACPTTVAMNFPV